MSNLLTPWEAWQTRIQAVGPNHPTVTPWCSAEQERAAGYWPYPWVQMPPGGLAFDPIAYIATPAANSVETVVLQFQVPFDYDGIILGVANSFSGPGFVEGSGDLTWRLRVGLPGLQGAPVRNYSAITSTLGSPGQARTVPGGIPIGSNQYVEYTVTHRLGSPIVPAGTRIMCNVTGYYWPRGSSSY